MSTFGSVIKYLVIYRLLTTPEVETAIICITLLLLLFFGAFVKLKNGVISWISYILLISIPITLLTINMINLRLPAEDLKLSDVKVEQYVAVTGNGLTFKRFLRRTANESLLGIQELKDEQRIADFTEYIKRAYPDGNVAYRTSKKYSGIILVDAAGNDLNLELIRDGYFNVSVKTPSQYLVAANDARSRGVGIWATTVGMSPDQMFEFTFYIFCFVLGVLSVDVYRKYATTTNITCIDLDRVEKYDDSKETKSSNRTDSNS